jgi:hypothetical protein
MAITKKNLAIQAAKAAAEKMKQAHAAEAQLLASEMVQEVLAKPSKKAPAKKAPVVKTVAKKQVPMKVFSKKEPVAKKEKVAKPVKAEGVVKGLTDRRLGKIAERAAEVMKYAKEHYEAGWDFVVECKTLAEIQQEMMEAKATSLGAALQLYRKQVSMRKEQIANCQ